MTSLSTSERINKGMMIAVINLSLLSLFLVIILTYKMTTTVELLERIAIANEIPSESTQELKGKLKELEDKMIFCELLATENSELRDQKESIEKELAEALRGLETYRVEEIVEEQKEREALAVVKEAEEAAIAKIEAESPLLKHIKSEVSADIAYAIYNSALTTEWPYHILAVIEKESRYNPRATNGPYIGMGQWNKNIWPSWLIRNGHMSSYADLFDPVKAPVLINVTLRGSCPACNDIGELLARYNGGTRPGAAARQYASEVMARAREMEAMDK